MVNDVPIYMAFLAGLISFLSPCVLPLVPGYVSFISGVSLEQLGEKGGNVQSVAREKATIVLNSIFFVIGFSTVFVLLGGSATLIGSFLAANMNFLTKIAGLVIVFFGLFKMGLLRIFTFYLKLAYKDY
jgi:cytochrome c-type biogenesis protein